MKFIVRQVLPPIALALIVLSAWQAVVTAFQIEKYLLPSPTQVVRAFVEGREELLRAAGFTIKAALAGLAASTLVGITVAILFSQSGMLRRSAYPYAIYLQTAPIVAIAPLIAVWIGEGIMAIIVVVFIISLFPVITNATDGLLAIPSELQELFRLNRATRWQTLWMLQLPQAMPRIITGIKISSAMVVLGATVGEYFVGSFSAKATGLGHVIFKAGPNLQTDKLFAATITMHHSQRHDFLFRISDRRTSDSLGTGCGLNGFRLLLLWLIVAAASGCRTETETTKPKTPTGNIAVTLQLNWLSDAQHGGFYAASVEGLYAAEGLDVQIIPGGPGTAVLPKVAMGRCDFAVANADQVLLARAQDADVVAVFAAMQNSPRCIMVHEKSGITKLEDLKNLTLALGDGKAFAEYLKLKVPLTDVRMVSYTGTVAKFLVDDNFAQQGYVFSEPLLAASEGGDPRALMVSELGFNPYSSVVVTRREVWEHTPDLVRKFVRATRAGWEAYLVSPDAANEAITKANSAMSSEMLGRSAKEIAKLCRPEGYVGELGAMQLARWETLGEQLVEVGLLTDSPDVSRAFVRIAE